MPNKSGRHRRLTARDFEVLSALDHVPLTVLQLLKLSQTFADPFTHPRLVRRRMQALQECGLVQQHRYATRSRGEPPAYYQLTLDGYQVLHGPTAQPPTRRYLRPVGWSHQRHTQCLADFIVHTFVAAKSRGLQIVEFHPENTVKLPVGDEFLLPDGTFQLALPSGRRFRYCVELDCATERITSTRQDTDSIERKLRLYAQHASFANRRYRTLIVTTAGDERLQNILRVAAEYERNPEFRTFYVTTLTDYLREGDVLFRPCFAAANQRHVALLQSAGRFEQPVNALANELLSATAKS